MTRTRMQTHRILLLPRKPRSVQEREGIVIGALERRGGRRESRVRHVAVGLVLEVDLPLLRELLLDRSGMVRVVV